MIRALPDLLSAQTFDQVKERIQRSVSAIGYDYFLIGIEASPVVGKSRHTVETNYPRNCVERYNRQRWVACDPVVRHCRQSPVPLVWHRAHFSGEARQLYEESVAHGISTGVATAVRGAAQSRAMMISVANGEIYSSKLEAWLTETMPTIQLLASYAYEAISRIEEASTSAAIGLTRREDECLHWAAAGKTSWEISRILGCSESTVNFHFRNVIHKLGVSNRRQAVARALSLGLIKL
ncbi:autoinducer binding domain-containing protein [Microbulbifer halophilus]|uniref:Autoinducer binding domain-containing protein n=1 Tax=Microbulbifer halophilus TaxID=453963 RepID=A0ABW5E6T0_9GAMM|nr:autoinducer binding domain-containing protein [Microbulbifer halophilus]MCW8126108.1 autoinducer binding domain-containing protein [Microbulbifer halophilus]